MPENLPDKMIRVRALKPCVCACPCHASKANHISTVLDEDENGNIVKKRKAFKSFVLQAPWTRPLRPNHFAKDAARIAQGLPSRLNDDGESITIPGNEVELPESYVKETRPVERGLIEIIDDVDAEPPKPKKVSSARGRSA